MKTLEIKKVLANYGLTKYEADLYLAGLFLGESSMTELSEKAGIKRPTAYKTFESLKEKGLMGSYKISSGQRFVATKPEILLNKIKQNVYEIENILPQLKNLQPDNKKKKAKITYFYGAQGYKNAIEYSLLKPNITLRHIGSLAELHPITTKEYDLNYYMPKRISKNIFLKSIYFRDTPKEVSDVEQHKFLRDIKYMPNEYFYKGATLVFEDKVIITSGSQELTTVMIESDDIANAEIQKFDLIWDLLKR